MLYVAIAIGTLVACEVALRLPLGRILATLTGSSRRAAEVVGSKRISDTWKERMLPVYARRIMTSSLGLFGCLLLIALPVVAVAAAVTGSLVAGSATLMQPVPLLMMIALGVAYVWMRTKVLA